MIKETCTDMHRLAQTCTTLDNTCKVVLLDDQISFGRILDLNQCFFEKTANNNDKNNSQKAEAMLMQP